MNAAPPIPIPDVTTTGTPAVDVRSAQFAREYCETFFAAEKPFIGGLPLTVEK
jgi:hypothetical protein